MNKVEIIREVIKTRRSIFPSSYNRKKISKEIIQEILESANWAPTHKYTEPWRFRVIRGDARARLGAVLSGWYKENVAEEKFSAIKFNKLKNNPQKASCLIAVCMKRDPKESVPEWEEIASVAMAVQNMYLTCTAHDIGSYWSSTKAILKQNDFLQLEEGERCLGLFFMGYTDIQIPEGKRETTIEEKVVWME